MGTPGGQLPPTVPLTLPVVAQFFNSHNKWLYITWRHHFSVCLSRSGILPSLHLWFTGRFCQVRSIAWQTVLRVGNYWSQRASCVSDSGRGLMLTRKLSSGSDCRRTPLKRVIFLLFSQLTSFVWTPGSLTLTHRTLKCSHRGQFD